jgi:hypothetical protein
MTLTADFVTGTNVPYQRLRWAMHRLGQTQEGVLEPGDFKVTQRATGGANMSVDIAAGDAWVDIDSGVRSGRAHIVNDATAPPENRAVAASHATLPRIDLVVLDYNDTSIPAGQGGNTPTIRVLTGAPTAGATNDNPVGAPNVPNDALLLGMFVVPAASTQVIDANIRDRRKRARGAVLRVLDATVGAFAGPTSSTTFQQAGALGGRMELSGALLRWRVRATERHTSGTFGADIGPWVDGAIFPSAQGGGKSSVGYGAPINSPNAVTLEHILSGIAAGTHLIYAGFGSGSGSGTAQLESDAVRNSELFVAEDIRPLGA